MRSRPWILVLAAALAAAACGAHVPPGRAGEGSSTVRSETRTVDEFERIEATGIVTLRVTVGPARSVTVRTDDNLLGSVRTETRSKTLRLDTTGDLRPTEGVRVTVTVPRLEEVRVSGAVEAVVEGFASDAADLQAQASGSSSLELGSVVAKDLDVSLSGVARLTAKDLRCKRLHVAVVGSGWASASGAADEVRLDADGTGKLELLDLAAKDVSATLDGASYAEVNVSASLRARARGTSKLVYAGNPAKLDKDAPPPAEVRAR